MDLEYIKENYKNFDDYKIEKIASEEAGSLRPEVIEILKAEIKKRNLNDNLIKSVDSQTNKLTETEFNEYCNLLRNHSCPQCNSKTTKLNVSMVGSVWSMVVLTNYDKKIKVACSGCLDDMNKSANIKSALLGWWGFPWGPIQTIRSFIYNSGMRKNNRTEKPNEFFQAFVLANIGVLEASRDNPEKLTEYLIRTNNRN